MRHNWSPWLTAAAADLPHLGLPEHWLACLRRAGFLPSRLSEGLNKALVDTFLYRLFSMYLAVLAERMAPGGQLPTVLMQPPPQLSVKTRGGGGCSYRGSGGRLAGGAGGRPARGEGGGG